MGRLAVLKNYARRQHEKLELEFPTFTWEETDDPVKMNAIFPPREWELDSPVKTFAKVCAQSSIRARADRELVFVYVPSRISDL